MINTTTFIRSYVFVMKRSEFEMRRSLRKRVGVVSLFLTSPELLRFQGYGPHPAVAAFRVSLESSSAVPEDEQATLNIKPNLLTDLKLSIPLILN